MRKRIIKISPWGTLTKIQIGKKTIILKDREIQEIFKAFSISVEIERIKRKI